MDDEQLEAWVRRVEGKLDDHIKDTKDTYVRKDIYELAHKAVWTAVNQLTSNIRWTGRTAVTAIVLPVVVAVVTAVMLSGRA
jgi:hypothetical protein